MDKELMILVVVFLGIGLILVGIFILSLWFNKPNRKIEAKKNLAEIDCGFLTALLLQEVRMKGDIDCKLSLAIGRFESDGPYGWYTETKRVLTIDPVKFAQIIDEISVETRAYLKYIFKEEEYLKARGNKKEISED